MAGASDEKTKVFEELAALPGQIVTARKDSVDASILSQDLLNAIGDAFTINDYQSIISELGGQRTLLKAGVLTDQLTFNFNTAGNYQAGTTFLLPSPNQFAYSLLDSEGNTLTLSDTSAGDATDISHFYFVKNKATGELVSVDDDLTAFLSPTLVEDVLEEVADFDASDNVASGTLINDPVLKQSPDPTIEIFLNDPSETKIGEIDEKGNITEVTNDTGTVIDISASVANLKNKTVEIHFSTAPVIEATVSLKYDYAATAVTTSENHTTFDAANFIFSRILSDTPILDSFVVYLNDTKRALSNRNGKIYSMDIDLNESLYDSSSGEVRVKFNDITTDSGNTARFDYIIKDYVQATDNIGGFQENVITITSYQTKNSDVDVSSVDILLDAQVVATADANGIITGAYDTADSASGEGTISGTIDASGGLNLTFTGESGGVVYPPTDKKIYVVYDFASGLSTWQDTYEILNIDSLATSSINLNLVNLLASDISKAPEILKTYPIKRHSNHQIYGNMIVVVEGLEINTDFLPVYIRNDGAIDTGVANDELVSADFNTSVFADNIHNGQTLRLYDYNGTIFTDYVIASHTGNTIIITTTFPTTDPSIRFEVLWPAEDATVINDTSFRTYFGWMQPSNESNDDNVKSANPGNTSNAGPNNNPDTDSIAIDSTSNGNDGTIIGGIRHRGIGKIGNAIESDGVNGRVVISTPVAGQSSSKVTVETWIYVRDLSNNRRIVYTDWPNDGWILFVYSNGSPTFVIAQSSTQYIAAGSAGDIQLNQWYHLVGVYDGTDVILYVNGIEIDRNSNAPGAILDISTNIVISNSSSTSMDGFIDDVRLWNTARTQAEIQDNMHKELLGNESGLAGYWKFNRKYPYIETNPFFPATEGNHTSNQPSGSGLEENDVFAGFYDHPESASGQEDQFDINSDVRWEFGPEPPTGTQSFPDAVVGPMATFKGLGFAPTNIPADASPTDYAMVGTELQEDGVRFTCKYNDVQDMLDGIIYSCITNMETLRTGASGGDGYRDPNNLTDDDVWWATVETVAADLSALETQHITWRNQYVDGVADDYNREVGGGNPSTLATTFQTELVSFYDTCFATTTGRLDVIEARFGDPATPGYVKDIYDVSNDMAGKDIGYLTTVIKAIVGNDAFYDRIDGLRKKYRKYEEADPN